MKKLTSMALALVLCLTAVNAFAAINPLYLYGFEKKNSSEPVDGAEWLRIPNNTASYEYSFGETKIYYSDFCIDISDTDTDMVIYYKSASAPHTVNISVKRVPYNYGDEPMEIYNKRLDVKRQKEKISIEAKKLKKGEEYYIELSDPEIDGEAAPEATGKIIVTGSWANGREITVSRGDFSETLTELIDEAPDLSGVKDFADLSKYNYPYEAVMSLKALGIVKGYGYDTFAPKSYITYSEAFTMAARLFRGDEGEYPVWGAAVCVEEGLTAGISARLTDALTAADCHILTQNIVKNREHARFNINEQ